MAAELTLPKPRVDVLLCGEIVPRAPVEQLDCTLELGHQLRKTLRVFGDRYWRPSTTRSVLPSRPKPFSRMPIAWERSFGGTDPDDPAVLDRRNPVGRGICKNPKTRWRRGSRRPNFEDPAAPIADPLKLHRHRSGSDRSLRTGDRAAIGPGPTTRGGRASDRRSCRRTSTRGFSTPRPRTSSSSVTCRTPSCGSPTSRSARRQRIRLPAFAPALTVVEGRTIFEVGVRWSTRSSSSPPRRGCRSSRAPSIGRRTWPRSARRTSVHSAEGSGVPCTRASLTSASAGERTAARSPPPRRAPPRRPRPAPAPPVPGEDPAIEERSRPPPGRTGPAAAPISPVAGRAGYHTSGAGCARG